MMPEQAKRVAHRLLVVEAGQVGRRPQSGQLYRPELLGPRGGKVFLFHRCRAHPVIFRLRSASQSAIAAIRMVVQLALVGVVLTTLFSVALAAMD